MIHRDSSCSELSGDESALEQEHGVWLNTEGLQNVNKGIEQHLDKSKDLSLWGYLVWHFLH